MKKSFKYRLYPNRSQAEALDATLEAHRRLYNLALRERRDVYESEERSVSYGEQSSRFKEARKAIPRFAATNFSSGQATLRRLDRTFKAFFRRVKRGETAGYPRFKPEGRFRTVEFPSYGDGCRLKDNGRLYLQNTGHLKVKQHRPIEGTIKTVSVTKSCGKWYVVFSCDLGDAPKPTDEGSAVGIDLGLKSFLVTSKGESVEPPPTTESLNRNSVGRNALCLASNEAPTVAVKLARRLPGLTRKRRINAGTFTTNRPGSSWTLTE